MTLFVDNLAFRYGHGFSLTAAALRFEGVAVVAGRNGAGKSTFLNCLTGLLHPDRLAARLDDQPLPSPHLGYLPEGDYFLGHLTGRENLEFQSFLKTGRKEAWKDQLPLLEELEVASLLDRPFRTGSMGMRRKLQLAASLIGGPGFLIWDEPHNGVDLYSNAVINRILKERATAGASVLLTSHIPEILREHGTSFFLVEGGAVRETTLAGLGL